MSDLKEDDEQLWNMILGKLVAWFVVFGFFKVGFANKQ